MSEEVGDGHVSNFEVILEGCVDVTWVTCVLNVDFEKVVEVALKVKEVVVHSEFSSVSPSSLSLSQSGNAVVEDTAFPVPVALMVEFQLKVEVYFQLSVELDLGVEVLLEVDVAVKEVEHSNSWFSYMSPSSSSLSLSQSGNPVTEDETAVPVPVALVLEFPVKVDV